MNLAAPSHRDVLSTLLVDEVHHAFDEARWITEDLRDGGEPISLGMGETWSRVPEGLVRRLADGPRDGHGYQLSMYGLPRLRKILAERIVAEHRAGAVPFDVAVTWSGTRSAMFDFGRWLRDHGGVATATPVLLTAAPGWDYAGVFEPLGFAPRYLPLVPEAGFRPSIDKLEEIVAGIRGSERLAIVAINAQQNPTGLDWDPSFVRRLIQLALDRGAAILVDDAYFAFHSPGSTPTSALAILHEELQRRGTTDASWLLVRSLGKQFHCNGWGLGAVAGPPKLLRALVHRYRPQHGYGYAGVFQHAMASWLADPESDRFLESERRLAVSRRAEALALLADRLGFPAEALHAGPCTPYLLAKIPPAYQARGGARVFLHECFVRTSVIVSDAWPLARASAVAGTLDWVRLYLGHPSEVLEAAVERMAAAGLRW